MFKPCENTKFIDQSKFLFAACGTNNTTVAASIQPFENGSTLSNGMYELEHSTAFAVDLSEQLEGEITMVFTGCDTQDKIRCAVLIVNAITLMVGVDRLKSVRIVKEF